MTVRLDYLKHADALPLQALTAISGYLHESDLDPQLLALIELRASQLNGCAYCIDMHTKDARAAGETEQRLYALAAWRETPFYSERERAALAWAEALTRISDGGVSDDDYRHARQQFTEKELVDLSLAVVAINGWNRLAIPFRTAPGTYHPSRPKVRTPTPSTSHG